MDDPTGMEATELVPKRSHLVGGELRATVAERYAAVPDHNERVAVVGLSCRDQLRHAHAAPRREHGHETLVLDILAAAETSTTAAAAVPGQTPQVGYQFALPR